MGGKESKPTNEGIVNNNDNNIVLPESFPVHNDTFNIVLWIIVFILLADLAVKLLYIYRKSIKSKYQRRPIN